MEIAIRQIEQLRSQLEESQDFISSIQEEAYEDRLYYRNRLNGLLNQLSQQEKVKYFIVNIVRWVEKFCQKHSIQDQELEEVRRSNYLCF